MVVHPGTDDVEIVVGRVLARRSLDAVVMHQQPDGVETVVAEPVVTLQCFLEPNASPAAVFWNEVDASGFKRGAHGGDVISHAYGWSFAGFHSAQRRSEIFAAFAKSVCSICSRARDAAI